LAEKLGVGQSVISRRLNGQTSMTIETIADLAWTLDLDIEVTIRDRLTAGPVPVAFDRFGDAMAHPVKSLAAERSRHRRGHGEVVTAPRHRRQGWSIQARVQNRG
jgi:transcriptional regulator with XRE-family HTH domain